MFDDLIAVTNRKLCERPFQEQIERVCSRHPKAVIVREKDLTEEEYIRTAKEILAICRNYQVPCMYHTFVEAAAKEGVPWIHLPLGELERWSGHEILKEFQTVGASVHSVEEAKRAEKMGASYVTAGHVYATDCKKGMPPRGLEFLKEVCRSVRIPVYAIGGIRLDPKQLAEVKNCGAAGACVMSGMMRL